MKIVLALVISVAPLFVGAEIYKSVDSDGHVVFSDKPTPGAKKIREYLTPTYTPVFSPQAEAGIPSVDGYYTALRIRKPASGETVREASGALTIDLEVVPPLKIKEGHVLVVAVDGNNLTNHSSATPFTISNLTSGAHTIKAQIIDATGQVQFSSDSITFNMQRAAETTSAKNPPTAPLYPHTQASHIPVGSNNRHAVQGVLGSPDPKHAP